MDSITEAALKSYREDIDHLEEQLDRTTRVILMLATHLGYLDRDALTAIVKNPQRVHVHVVYSDQLQAEEDGKVGPGIALEITQPKEDDEPALKAKLLPRFKLERAYIAERSRADLAHATLAELRAEIAERETDDQDDPAPEDRPTVGQPIAPTLDGKPKG